MIFSGRLAYSSGSAAPADLRAKFGQGYRGAMRAYRVQKKDQALARRAAERKVIKIRTGVATLLETAVGRERKRGPVLDMSSELAELARQFGRAGHDSTHLR